MAYESDVDKHVALEGKALLECATLHAALLSGDGSILACQRLCVEDFHLVHCDRLDLCALGVPAEIEPFTPAARTNSVIVLIEFQNLDAPTDKILGAVDEEELVEQMIHHVQNVMAFGFHFSHSRHLHLVRVGQVREESHTDLCQRLFHSDPPGVQDHVCGVIHILILADLLRLWQLQVLALRLAILASAAALAAGAATPATVACRLFLRGPTPPPVPRRQRLHHQALYLNCLRRRARCPGEPEAVVAAVILYQGSQLWPRRAHLLGLPGDHDASPTRALRAIELRPDTSPAAKGRQVLVQILAHSLGQGAQRLRTAEWHLHHTAVLQDDVTRVVAAALRHGHIPLRVTLGDRTPQLLSSEEEQAHASSEVLSKGLLKGLFW
mmetsp:Transcript_80905/g.179788  ORF Transcript_80905/g.179788 Transcript_80905/m.179788 type:complete len:382 (+) Transcript_80905:60-1205(+)|eukprot:CAMPEP_0180424406 /NCGR_PEP_ID=MMETSP1036_2-20121128/4723_1 /TAXON_ID=632150 /ORGANISM="Azadinium spinosum, Strain 3D9" /LENGTH=381 /DNA_ID=CAMNT_0022429847 /DNA_START=58 /DNA_END=1203 /DNA_ORIENTATION=+